MLPRRCVLKRLKNRLAKYGLAFDRLEQADPHLSNLKLIMTTREGFGRAFSYDRRWLLTSPGRVIADTVLEDYERFYGMAPA